MLAIKLILSALLVGSSWADGGGCKKPGNFDELMLSIQSGPGNGVHGREPRWSIHGLWPQRKNEWNYTDCCARKDFNLQDLTGILKPMKKYWFSLRDGTERFWSYEWRKHGTCAGGSNFASPPKFFETGISLYNQLNLNAFFREHKIVNTRILAGKLHHLLTQWFGAEPQIVCGKNRLEKVVREIRFCFDPVSLDPINCRGRYKSCSGSNQQASNIIVY